MKLLKQPSFRRIMLWRVLLVSIPILLIGVAVAFRKARTSLLYTARQNLAESALRKSHNVQSSVQALQVGLITASESLVFRSGSPDTFQPLLDELKTHLTLDESRPNLVCLQVLDWNEQTVVASTCGDESILLKTQDDGQIIEGAGTDILWPRDRGTLDNNRFYIQSLSVDISPEPSPSSRMGSHLDLLIETPIYGEDDKPRYILAAEAQLTQIESGEPGSLLGYTMIVNEDGTILAHPLSERVGTKITEQGDPDRYKSVFQSALRGEQDVRHLFHVSNEDREWLAGYSTVQIAISPTQNQTWAVFAVTPLDNALHGLQEIKRILVILTAVLLVAHLFAMLYTARDLARPIERLGRYARQIHNHSADQLPRDFKIREINQLAHVLENMVRRLEERATELESAWQEAETANQLKNEFLANTSHELRTPLNAIIGCIRLVRDDCCDGREEELEFLERADEAAIHLLKIINDLLDIAKIEAGTLSLSMEEIDIGEILHNVIDLQTVEAHQKGLWLNGPQLPSGIITRADPAKLKQVFLNIIYNAIKFTDQGGITVDTRIAYYPEGMKPEKHRGKEVETSGDASAEVSGSKSKPWIIVSIKDTGIGIDPSQQHKLFRPFVMVDGSTTRKFEGTGLGLAISRNLVELMNGTIALYSDGMGRGTTVEIALPVFHLPAQDHEVLRSKSAPSVVSGPGELHGNAETTRSEQTVSR